MGAVGEKARQPVFRLGDCVGPRDADRGKAVSLRGLAERGLQRRGIAQKSRSA
jgi:hypothetical protein